MYKEYQVRVHDSGSKFWYFNGKFHREDGPAIECADGAKEWYLNDERHREDGPAIEYVDGTKEWWFNGKRHREDGPAIEWFDGSKEWYLHGKQVSQGEVEGSCDNKVVEIDGKKYKLVREL